MAIDSTGEFIAAGGQDVFEAYLWSMKIGKLLEVSIINYEDQTYACVYFNIILGFIGTRRTYCECSLQSGDFKYYFNIR